MSLLTKLEVLGKTQAEIAERCGVSSSTINKYASYETIPPDMSYKVLKCFASSLSMSVDEFINYVNEDDDTCECEPAPQGEWIDARFEEVKKIYAGMNKTGRRALYKIAKSLQCDKSLVEE